VEGSAHLILLAGVARAVSLTGEIGYSPFPGPLRSCEKRAPTQRAGLVWNKVVGNRPLHFPSLGASDRWT